MSVGIEKFNFASDYDVLSAKVEQLRSLCREMHEELKTATALVPSHYQPFIDRVNLLIEKYNQAMKP